jgi:thiol-disulfide isomerase/thioredoxin
MVLPALLTVVALVALATAAGLVGRARTGRVRRAPTDRVDVAALGVAAASGERATLLQFSTAMCAPCVSTARLLAGLAAETPGVAHVDVGLEELPHLADRFGILQTPTTLLLDAEGVVRGRIAGAPRPHEVRRSLEHLLEVPDVPIR